MNRGFKNIKTHFILNADKPQEPIMPYSTIDEIEKKLKKF